jgi:hypothetical protein
MSALGAENAVPVGWARALGKPRPCGGEMKLPGASRLSSADLAAAAGLRA